MVINTARAESRDRMLIAAVWLIGLGSVFLVKELAQWSWPQAWPMFVILLGVGGLGTAIFSRHRSASGWWGIWWPLAVTVMGVALLLSTTGTIAIAPGQLVAWWPVAVIGLGVWFLIGALFARPQARNETLSLPLGAATEADVVVRFGGGELAVGPAEPGTLVSGQFDGGVLATTGRPGRVELKPYEGGWMFWDRPLRWNLGLTSEVPVDLRLESGANRSAMDLSALTIRRLVVKTGASETRIRLPAHGSTSVRADAGVAALTLEVPEGVAARIRSKMALGSTNVDERRFPRTLDGWASPDYDTAGDRVDMEIEGGLGSIRVA
jgi:hypothetical protein